MHSTSHGISAKDAFNLNWNIFSANNSSDRLKFLNILAFNVYWKLLASFSHKKKQKNFNIVINGKDLTVDCYALLITTELGR